MQNYIVILMIILSSCGPTQEKSENISINKVENPEKSLCGEDMAIDTSKLKIGSVNNLRLYNGVKFLKFNQPKKVYLNCLKCNKDGNLDMCSLSYPISFLDKDWNARCYFINDTLCQIELIKDDVPLAETFDQLQVILGKPNLQSIKATKVENSSKTYTINADDKRQLKPYSENISYYISYLHGNRKGSGSISIDLLNNPNQYYKKIAENRYEGKPQDVRIQFLPYLELQATWEAKTILQCNIIKKSVLQVGMGANVFNQESNVNKITHGYKVENTYSYRINLFRDKKTLLLFEHLSTSKLQKQKEAVKRNELEEKKKVLQQF